MEPKLHCPRCSHTNPARAVQCHACGLSLQLPGNRVTLGPDDVPKTQKGIMFTRTAGRRTHEDPLIPPLPEGFESLGPSRQGAMGVIYHAREIDIDREVAVKRLFRRIKTNASATDALRREARAVGRLNHPNIIQIYRFDTDKYGSYLVMEWVDKGNLEDLVLRRGPLHLWEIRHLTQDICHALSAAHKAGVIHRDFKPANTLITHCGVPKVGDFGIACVTGAADFLKTNQVAGTPLYMAPEQRDDAKHVDHRADIYALARTVYFMLTGRHSESILLDQVAEPLRRPLHGALSERAEDRPFSVAEFLLEFDAAAEQVLLGDSQDSELGPAQEKHASLILSMDPSPPSRWPWVLAALAVVVIAITLYGLRDHLPGTSRSETGMRDSTTVNVDTFSPSAFVLYDINVNL